MGALEEVTRDYCVFCDEPMKQDASGIVVCIEHGQLDHIDDEEWGELAKERE